jgi:carboxyl-terminal processing protease
MLLPFALLLAADVKPDVRDVEAAVRQFVTVYSAIEQNSATPVDSSAAIYGGALPSMLRDLDPHSVFLDPDQFQQLKEMSNAEQKGFGSIVSILPGRVFVLQTLPGTPSARSGLSPGDEIVAVNNIALGGLEPEQLIQVLSQSRRQPARIWVRRASSPRLLDFLLTPETVASPSVDRAYFLEPGIGYIRIANFELKTAAELEEAIGRLGGDSLKGLVIDLRNNPGGVVESALRMASLFLPAGTPIMTARGRNKKEETVTAPEGSGRFRFPLVLLINEKTASAAEIVAASLQDHGRAKIVGTRSYGKGLVQTVYPLSQQSGMALTVAFYYSPKGRNIQRPLKDVQLAPGTNAADRGGVAPDETAAALPYSRLRAVLDGSGALTAFATEYVRAHPGLTDAFEVDGPLLDELKVWLSERKIQPAVADWSRDLVWIRSRLKQEIFNLALGVEKGDEVEAARDPEVQRAAGLLRQAL